MQKAGAHIFYVCADIQKNVIRFGEVKQDFDDRAVEFASQVYVPADHFVRVDGNFEIVCGFDYRGALRKVYAVEKLIDQTPHSPWKGPRS